MWKSSQAIVAIRGPVFNGSYHYNALALLAIFTTYIQVNGICIYEWSLSLYS